MPFPECKRVKYENNPLIEVVCQIRFPRILKINTTVPDQFQENIRDIFPIYHETIEHQQGIQINSNQNSMPVPRFVQGETTKNYRFSSADGLWHINLTSTFISLTTTNYTVWEDFKGKLITAVNGLEEIYSPAFCERIGLRYIDAFNKKKLKAEHLSWKDMFKPYIIGLYGSDEVGEHVLNCSMNSEVELANDVGVARLVTGLGKVNGIEGDSFVIDSDIYNLGRTECKEIFEKLENLHSEASRLLDWSITEELRQLMNPKELDYNE